MSIARLTRITVALVVVVTILVIAAAATGNSGVSSRGGFPTVVLGVSTARQAADESGGPPGRPSEPGRPESPGSHARSFSIDGDVSGLYPGAELELPLDLTNPNAFAIEVTKVAVAVDDAGQACGVSSPGLDDAVTVPGRSTTTSSVTIRMAPSATDDCQGESFALTYRGQAVKA